MLFSLVAAACRKAFYLRLGVTLSKMDEAGAIKTATMLGGSPGSIGDIASEQSDKIDTAQPKKKWRKRNKHKYKGKEQNAKPPNYFFAVRVSSPEVKGRFKAVQEHIVAQERLLHNVIVNVATAHLTLGILHLPDDETVTEAVDLLQSCKDDIDNIVQDVSLNLNISGIGHFHSKVVFAKIVEDQNEIVLREIADLLQNKFSPLKSDSKFDYTPHLTLMKLSKLNNWKLRKKIRRINPKYYESCKDISFGIQQICSLQLLAMFEKKQSDGYYHCVAEIPLGSHSTDPNQIDPEMEYAKFISSYCILSGALELLHPIPEAAKESELSKISEGDSKLSTCGDNSDEIASGGCGASEMQGAENMQITENTDGCVDATVASPKPRQNANVGQQRKIKDAKGQSSNKWMSAGEQSKSNSTKEFRKPPNYFLAVQITNPEVKNAMKAAQDQMVEKNALLEKVIVNTDLAHFTLALLYLPDQNSVAEARKILSSCQKHVSDLVQDAKLDLTITGVDHFDKEVVFAKLLSDENERKLREIAMFLRGEFKTLEADDPFGYNPHLTLMKLAKVRGWRDKQKIPCIEPVYFKSCESMFFGVQSVQSIQLLAMKKRKGYYRCEKQLPLRMPEDLSGP